MSFAHTISVSVIVPVYNAGEFLGTTLDSILTQTLSDIEIICVDDGSTDNSREILQEAAARNPRLKIIRQANAGPGAARNAGMQAASGEYLAFLDADDLYEPDMLETMYRQARQFQADVVMCRCDYFSSSQNERHRAPDEREIPGEWLLRGFHPAGDAAESLFQLCVGWPWDKLFRTEYVRAHGWDFPPLRNSEDGVFVYPAVAHAQAAGICERILVHHREHPGSVSKTLNLWPTECIKAIRLIFERLEGLNAVPAIKLSFSTWARHYVSWNLRELQCDARWKLREAVRNILEPQFKLALLPPSDQYKEYMDYQSLAAPAARVEILAGMGTADTLRECIRSFEEQEKAALEIVVQSHGNPVSPELLAMTRAYLPLPTEAECPVLRISADRAVKWNALNPSFILSVASRNCGRLTTRIYDIRKRSRFYCHTATVRSWRLWGHGILTLRKKGKKTAVYLLGYGLGAI